MSETPIDAAAVPAEPSASDLAAKLIEILRRDRDPAAADLDYRTDFRPRTLKKREPFFPPKVAAAFAQCFRLWPLFLFNCLALWLSLVVFSEGSYAPYAERIARILQLLFLALIVDIWLNPLEHPDAVEGPAKGARQYQRVYLIGIVVLAGCLSL